MGQRLKKSALMFGQVSKEPPKPTLSEFYRGVGEGQVGAVGEVTKGVKEKTAGIPGQFGVSYGEGGGAQFTEGSPFKPTVTFTTTTQPMPADFGTTSSDASKVAETAGKTSSTLEKEEKDAEVAAGKAATDALTKAGEKSKELGEQLTEKKLGERREASELEMAAKDYRNILTTTPGTSNVEAVASLMKFYDPKYKTLESGLRQGEIALARQQAGVTEGAMGQAEGERVGAIQEYKTTSEKAYEDTKKLIDKEKEDSLKKIDEYYGGLRGKAETTKADAEKIAGERKAEEDKAEVQKINLAGESIKNNPTMSGISQMLKDFSGRAGNNHLNIQGHKALLPIKSAIEGLVDKAVSVQNDPNLPLSERTKQLEDINKQINGYRGQIAGELTAFLDDQNTNPDDALGAAEQLMARGFIDDLTPEQKTIILNRLRKDSPSDVLYPDKSSRARKRQNIISAFGGGSLAKDAQEARSAQDGQPRMRQSSLKKKE